MICKVGVTINTRKNICLINDTNPIRRVGDANKLLPTGIREVAHRWEVEEATIIKKEVITRECATGLPSLTKTDLLYQLYLKARIPRISTS